MQGLAQETEMLAWPIANTLCLRVRPFLVIRQEHAGAFCHKHEAGRAPLKNLALALITL
jgi:hypothetical protein